MNPTELSRRTVVRIAVRTVLLVLTLHGGSAEAQTTATLTGRVVSASTNVGVENARITLRGHGATLTNARGEFQFQNVPHGSHTLDVAAFGYADTAVAVVIITDTVLEIRVAEGAIVLDSLTAVLRRVTIRGRVTDEERGLGVRGRVYVAPSGADAETNGTGRYRIRDAPVADSTYVAVEAFGYLPERVYLTTLADTAIDFVLETDPVAERMMEIELERLTARSEATVPYPTERITRDDWTDSGSIANVLDKQFHLSRARCVIIDEVKAAWPSQQLRAMPSDDVAFIEIIDRAIANRPEAEMIRIYTRDFERRMVLEKPDLGRIIVYRRGPTSLCR